MPTIRAWALYCPGGRLSDFFASRSACPGRSPYGDWRTSDIEKLEQFVGEMWGDEYARFLALADSSVYDIDACRISRQQQYRERLHQKYSDSWLADVPQEWPAE